MRTGHRVLAWATLAVALGCEKKVAEPVNPPDPPAEDEPAATPDNGGEAPRLRQRKPPPAPVGEVRQFVANAVAQGYRSRDEIIDDVVDSYGSEFPEEELQALAEQETDADLAAHAREEARWKGLTDCDRLDQAFAKLERQGILARQNYADCQTCGVSDISAEMKEAHGKGRRVVGYTFFHEQDIDDVAGLSELYLSYGSYADDEKAGVRVGHEVTRALGQAGLKTRWSGSLDERIAVVDLTWRKRRHGR